MRTLRSCIVRMIEYLTDSDSETLRTIRLLLVETFRSIPMNFRQSSVSERMRYMSVSDADRHTIQRSFLKMDFSVWYVADVSMKKRSSQRSEIFSSSALVFLRHSDSSIRIEKEKMKHSLWDVTESVFLDLWELLQRNLLMRSDLSGQKISPHTLI